MVRDLAKVPSEKDEEKSLLDVAEPLMAKHTFATNEHNMDDFIVFRDGYWKREAEEVILREVTQALGDEFSRSCYYDVREYIRGQNFKDVTEPDIAFLNLRNGMYNIGTGDFVDIHSDSLYFRNRLEIDYKPDAKCPKFLKFLHEVLTGADIATIQEMFGYCLHRSYPIQAIFMLVGGGGNGKTTLLRILQKFLGKENVLANSIADLTEDKFIRSNLQGKLANIFADLSDTVVEHSAYLKILSGNDMITARLMRMQKGINFENYAKLIFSTNRPPVIRDPSNAMWRRVVEIDFENEFKGPTRRRQNDLIIECTTPEELSGMLLWALEGLRRLLKNQEFSNAAELEQRRKDYAKKAQSSVAFCQDKVILDPTYSELKKDVYDAYIAYCKELHVITDNEQVFWANFKQEFAGQYTETHTRSGTKRARVIKGIKIAHNIRSDGTGGTGDTGGSIQDYARD